MIKVLRTIYDHNGKTYKAGSVISEDVFKPKFIDRLFKSKAIEYVELKPTQSFKGEIKPVIVTGMWKRHEVFEIFAKHTKKLGIGVIVAGSDTHVICVGSDDLLSKELIDEYLKLMRKGYDYIGVTDFYFYEMESGKAAYWGGYRDRQRIGHTAGAGRVISNALLDEWDWLPWDDKDSKYLDNSMQNKLRSSLHPKTTFSLKEKGLLAVDIKSQVNMTPFELWDNTSYIDPKLITDNFNVRNSGNN
jgi:hypothetical protein